MKNTRQQEKYVLVKYTERLKQENRILKSSTGEDFLGNFVKTTKEFKKLDEVNDTDEIIEMKKNAFEV